MSTRHHGLVREQELRDDDDAESWRGGVSPGKRLLTMHLSAAPGPGGRAATRDGLTNGAPRQLIQRKAAAPGPDPFDHHAMYGLDGAASVAAAGVAGASEPLPYAAQIQRAFGHHDVSAIKTSTGSAARAAAQSLGARAYATGNTIAFAKAPDLHTAAHEAAHVVQQRGGVQLKGDIGEAGDRYERHADAVADRVVAGESAVELLDQMAPANAAVATEPGSKLQLERDDSSEAGPASTPAAGLGRELRQLSEAAPKGGVGPVGERLQRRMRIKLPTKQIGKDIGPFHVISLELWADVVITLGREADSEGEAGTGKTNVELRSQGDVKGGGAGHTELARVAVENKLDNWADLGIVQLDRKLQGSASISSKGVKLGFRAGLGWGNLLTTSADFTLLDISSKGVKWLQAGLLVEIDALKWTSDDLGYGVGWSAQVKPAGRLNVRPSMQTIARAMTTVGRGLAAAAEGGFLASGGLLLAGFSAPFMACFELRDQRERMAFVRGKAAELDQAAQLYQATLRGEKVEAVTELDEIAIAGAQQDVERLQSEGLSPEQIHETSRRTNLARRFKTSAAPFIYDDVINAWIAKHPDEDPYSSAELKKLSIALQSALGSPGNRWSYEKIATGG